MDENVAQALQIVFNVCDQVTTDGPNRRALDKALEVVRGALVNPTLPVVTKDDFPPGTEGLPE